MILRPNHLCSPWDSMFTLLFSDQFQAAGPCLWALAKKRAHTHVLKCTLFTTVSWISNWSWMILRKCRDCQNTLPGPFPPWRLLHCQLGMFQPVLSFREGTFFFKLLFFLLPISWCLFLQWTSILRSFFKLNCFFSCCSYPGAYSFI